MRAKKYHGLKRVKLRQTWNKYNLYNLSRFRTPIYHAQTYFQQKWSAKSNSRAYHGETMLEKHWTRMFKPNIRAVIPMNPKYLAQNDGSRFAMGRGSGVEGGELKEIAGLPYMNMTYAATERRLDTAIFRALFASSTRQARQFVVHGYVKVNGKQMLYPAYQLNPGDLFQVEPERVLFATGAPKGLEKSRSQEGDPEKEIPQEDEEETEEQELDDEAAEVASDAESEAVAVRPNPRSTLRELLSQAKAVVEENPDASAKRKRSLREFQRLLRKAMSRKEEEPTIIGDMQTQLSELTSKLSISEGTATTERTDGRAVSTPGESLTITNEEKRQLEKALAIANQNPADPSKPYATPWRPRDYMSAFAFIPRYLEVHQNICSAVYLRHPVVRPGLAEVPTPFNTELLGLAFNWYLRRR